MYYCSVYYVPTVSPTCMMYLLYKASGLLDIVSPQPNPAPVIKDKCVIRRQVQVEVNYPFSCILSDGPGVELCSVTKK